jgi:hypothetical protein
METFPTLDPGVTRLRRPDPAGTAMHRLVCDHLVGSDGDAYWVDVGGTARTTTLYDHAADESVLRDLRVARAFTPHDHHELVRRVARRADADAALVVAPNADAHYRDADCGSAEANRLRGATERLLAAVGDLGVPVLVTGEVASDRTLDCERTREGLRFAGDGFETTVYPGRGYWQTTLAYWVDLYGAADAEPLAESRSTRQRRLAVV